MSRRALLLVVLAAVLAAAPARAADVVGIADQSPAMFAHPAFRALDVRVSRLIVSYDAVLRGTFEVADIDAWMAAAQASGVQPLVAFNSARGCYVAGHYRRVRACRLPSVARYRAAVRAFRLRYPQVSVYTPWNEANHHSQPTYRHPARAAAYYGVLRKLCRRCTITAAVVLDQSNMARWLKAFLRRAPGRPRLWGLHNYKDTNDHRTRGTRRMLKTVKGTVWLTETGGIVKFSSRRYDPARAARATRFMFRLAASSRRIKRLYIYQWTGQPRTARFDAGLTDQFGAPRPAYRVVAKHLARPGGNPQPAPAPAPPPPSPAPSPTPSPTPTPTPGICLIPELCLPTSLTSAGR